MKLDLISAIFQLHGLSMVFRSFLKNVKTLEPKTYITILRTSLDKISRGPYLRPCAAPHVVVCDNRSLKIEDDCRAKVHL